MVRVMPMMPRFAADRRRDDEGAGDGADNRGFYGDSGDIEDAAARHWSRLRNRLRYRPMATTVRASVRSARSQACCSPLASRASSSAGSVSSRW
jgi:hypothetical protein